MNATYQLRPLTATCLAIVLGSSLFLAACTDKKTSETANEPVPTTSAVTDTNPQLGGKKPNTNDPMLAAFGGPDKQGSDPMSLLLTEQVKQEVKITSDQSTQIKEVTNEIRENVSKKYEELGLDKLDAAKKQEKLTAASKDIESLIKDSRTKIDKIIKPDQAKRLKEIVLQVYGWGPLTSELLSTELKLTDKQKADLKTIQKQMFAQKQTSWEIPSGDPSNQTKILSSNRKRMEQILKDVNEQSLAVLTPEQKTTLEKLKGVKFSYVPPIPGTPLSTK